MCLAIEMRTIEHNLCELDKYERVRLGQGKVRSYHPQQGANGPAGGDPLLTLGSTAYQQEELPMAQEHAPRPRRRLTPEARARIPDDDDDDADVAPDDALDDTDDASAHALDQPGNGAR